MIQKLVIYGVGLIGGSIGLAAKKKNIAHTVVGVGRNPEHLDHAVQKGAVDVYYTDLAEGLRDADFVIVCLPVEQIVDLLPHVAEHAPAKSVVTDVGSTKKVIVEQASRCFRSETATFIGSHPLAGSERSGIEHAKASLFKGTTCFITVAGTAPEDPLRLLVKFWRAIGARPCILSPERHDYLVGMSSHAVHMAAACLTGAVGNLGEDPNLLRLIVGTGFKDTTRLSKSDVDLWVEICRHNAMNISGALEKVCDELDSIRDALERGDFEFVHAFLERARSARTDLD